MPAKGYKYVEHTADVEFIASGGTPATLLKNALLATFETSAYISALRKSGSKARRITVKDVAPDLSTLLWYVLQDALSVADAEGLFLYRVESVSVRMARNSLIASAKLLGKGREPRYSKLDVKGVSRYDLKVWRAGRAYRASVVLDV